MSSDDPSHEKPMKDAMKSDFAAGQGTDASPLFKPDELDIYVNKITMEAYIFHGKDVVYDLIDHLEYDDKDYSVTIVQKNGVKRDLGVKIQWLVRPYWKNAGEVNIVQTKNGESINGCFVPLVHVENKS